MARTFSVIYTALINEKNALAALNGLQPSIDDSQTMLTDLTSPTRVADWRVWIAFMAFCIMALENFLDLFRKEVDAKAKTIIPMTAPYLAERVKNFQLGDDLVWIGSRFDYAVINPALRIVNYVAIVESAGQVIIKVAKDIGAGPVPLDPATEMPPLDDYTHKLCPPGTNRVLQSSDPDYVTMQLNAFFNPLVIASDGSLVGSPSVFPLEDAINNYFRNLPFNGKFRLNDFVDAMQNAPGIINPTVVFLYTKYGALAYQPMFDEYIPDAGYLIVDPATPLNTSIIYSADV